MRIQYFGILFILFTLNAFSQVSLSDFKYEPNETYPFGRPNPDAPEQIKDYQHIIGLSDCKSLKREVNG